MLKSVSSENTTAFEKYAAEVDSYARTWFSNKSEPHESFLAGNQDLKTRLFLRAIQGQYTSTGHVYSDSGHWHPVRKEFQDGLVSQQIPSMQGLPSTGPVYFLIGLPGSGKSTGLRPLVEQHAGLPPGEVQVSDADDLRSKFPEYADGLGSGVVQDECAELMYARRLPEPYEGQGLQEANLSAAGVVIVDVIGDPEYLPATVRKLSKQRRDVYVLQTQCPVEICIDRAMARALDSGRFVPPVLIAEKVGVPEKALDAAKATGKLAGWAVVDTSGSASVVVQSEGFDLPEEKDVA